MLVVGANLALDRTLRVGRLVPGHVARPDPVTVTPGGKSVNVLRAARAHGVHATLVANLPGRGGQSVHEQLAAEGHTVVPVPTAGEVRCAVIVVEDDGRVTVLNEPGPALSATDAAGLLSALETAASTGEHRVVVASGSLPPSADPATYATVVSVARRHGMLAVIDAARDALDHVLPAGPDVVSPNLAEAEALLYGRPDEAVEAAGDDVLDRAERAALALQARGARAALVSAGRHGLAGADEAGTFRTGAPSVREVNPIGAGDALVAGVAVALERGATLRDAVTLGVATAAASVAHPLAGGVDGRALADALEQLHRDVA
jgi:1-phosphofructokinase family hexose kinase